MYVCTSMCCMCVGMHVIQDKDYSVLVTDKWNNRRNSEKSGSYRLVSKEEEAIFFYTELTFVPNSFS